MIAITGNTYPVKEQIKALGGKWNADQKAWMVPESKAVLARQLVSGAPRQTVGGGGAKTAYKPTKCIVCGHVETRNSRGYIDGATILRNGECTDCYEERKMGY